MAIVEDEIRDIPEKYKLLYMHTTSGTGTIPSATVRICIEGEREIQESAWGDGPVDATYKAIAKATSTDVQVDECHIRSVTHGAEAMGEVTVKVSGPDDGATGRGASTDIIQASAKAYIDALNHLALRSGVRRHRTEAV